MRTIIQRVSRADVSIESLIKAKIGKGILVLVGIEDTEDLMADLDQALAYAADF